MEGDNQEDALTAYPFMMDPVKNIARTYKFSVPILLVFSGIAAMGFAEGQFINSCWGLEVCSRLTSRTMAETSY